MGLMDELAGQVFGGGTQGGGGQAVGAILEMLNGHSGGLQGMAQQFQRSGMGDIISSWIGTGQNLPISAGQVQQVLGSGVVQQLATKLGVSSEDASGHLAQWLPTIVDQLTPGGAVPQGDLMSEGMNLLKGLLSR